MSTVHCPCSGKACLPPLFQWLLTNLWGHIWTRDPFEIYLATSPALSQQNQDIKDNLVSPKIKTFPSSDVVWKAVLGKLTVAPTNLLWRRLKSFPQGFAQKHRSQAKEWATKTKTFPLCNCCFLFFLLLPTLPISNLNFWASLAKIVSNGIETKCMCFSLEKKFLCCRLFLQPGSLFLAAVVLGDTLGDLLTHFFLLCLTSPQTPNGDYSYYHTHHLDAFPKHPPTPRPRIFSRLYTLFHLNIKPC